MTWWGGHFVRGGKRRLESVRGLGSLGVALERQHYAGLEDGRLAHQAAVLGEAALKLAEQHSADTVVSFGPDGFDGHRDHQVTFAAAAMVAQAGLRHVVRADSTQGNRNDYDDQSDQNNMVYAGDPAVKLAAMAHHASQYDLQAAGFWQDMAAYKAQLGVEHYRVV